MVKTESNQMSSRSSPSRSPSPSPPSSSCSKKKFKGVRMRKWGSWVSEIRAPNQKTRIWLGSYSTAEAAARAYDAALLCLKGSSAANLNFPISDSSPYIPQHDAVLSPKSIQRVAAAAANSYITNIANNTTSPSPSSSCSFSSSSDDDDVTLTQSLGPHNDGAICNMVDQSWYNMEGPLDHEILCPIDQMYNVAPFDSLAVMDDFEEEAYTIPLWSFCS